MKKFIILMMILALLCTAAGCAAGEERDISGSWYSEGETLIITGRHVEITGYYEHDGHRFAGVVTEGRITPERDGSYTINVEGNVRRGFLKDEDTLILDGTEYKR